MQEKNINFERDKKRYLKEYEKVLNSNISEENKEDFKKYIVSLRAEGVKFSRLVNVASYFYIFCTHFFKDKRIIDLTRDDYNNLIVDLRDGIIKSVKDKDKPYGYNQILNFQKFFRAYFNRIHGDVKAREILGKIRIKQEEIDYNKPYLKKVELDMLIDKIPFEQYEIRFVLIFMFATGCRVGEFRSMRIKDVYIDDEGDLMANIPKIKTKERLISIDLYKPLIQNYIDEYLIGTKGKSEEDLLIEWTEQTINKNLKIVCSKYLGENSKKISSHGLRHSSATYYAQLQQLTPQQFWKRFGWTVKSRESERYYDKVELGKTKAEEGIKKDETMKFSYENKELKIKVEELTQGKVRQDDKINALENTVNKIQELLHTEKSKKFAVEQHIQKFRFKDEPKRDSDFIIPNGLNYEELVKVSENSPFFTALRRWEKDLQEYIQVEVKGENIKIHAQAIIYKKMYASFNQEILDELKQMGVTDEESFETLMLHIITRTIIIKDRADKEIEKEMAMVQN